MHDPLLCVFPKYGSVTGIACVSIPSPFVSLERTTQATEPSEVEDDVDSEEESPMDAGEWLSRGAISSYSVDDGQASLEPPLLDHSFLARLTSDISEDMTPLALVCIARAQDLYSAMASCLHQRWAWDITEPLMGIAMDDSTSSVRLVFGCLLQSIDDSTCMSSLLTLFSASFTSSSLPCTSFTVFMAPTTYQRLQTQRILRYLLQVPVDDLQSSLKRQGHTPLSSRRTLRSENSTLGGSIN